MPYNVYGETLAYKYNGYLSSKTITSTGKYTYSYDTSGHLVEAAWSDIGGADYSSTYSYDPRGNITAMKRWGMTDRLPDGVESNVRK